MHPALTYTLLALCAALLVFGIWLDGPKARARFPRARRVSLALQAAAVLAAYVVLRPGAGTDGAAAVRESVAAGQPLLLDIYSNW
jgi:hypothetical protein